MKELVGININKPVLKIKYSELKRVENDESPHKSCCPACKEGYLFMLRHADTMMLKNIDRCMLCGQSVEYIDIPDNKIHYLNPNLTLRSGEMAAGKKYDMNKVECYSCGKKFSPDTEDGVTYQDTHLIYFCEECSDKKEHVKYAKKYP